MEFFVPGTPAPFATGGEREWRDVLVQTMPLPSMNGSETGVELCFNLELKGKYKPGDIGNLCEPVFSVMANRLGWFRGRRPNIQWWRATRQFAAPVGCSIRISNEAASAPLMPATAIQSIYTGVLLKHARDDDISEWCRTCLSLPGTLGGYTTFGCAIEFESSAINIGDIATGRVKNIIDCLYPTWGGMAGSPNDHLVADLYVGKGMVSLPQAAVRIAIWHMEIGP